MVCSLIKTQNFGPISINEVPQHPLSQFCQIETKKPTVKLIYNSSETDVMLKAQGGKILNHYSTKDGKMRQTVMLQDSQGVKNYCISYHESSICCFV